MISSSIKESAPKPEKPKFPVLMEWMGDFDRQDGPNSRLIVLFTSATVGVVVNADNMVSRYIGEGKTDFFSCNEKSHWKKFDGVINLEND